MRKQFQQEHDKCVATQKDARSQYLWCGDDVRFEAFTASLFWPQHWSEALWK